MQIVCISRGTHSHGKELAEALARKLGCRCLSREEMLEKATEAGIAVGKLEAAMLRPNLFNERLMLEKEHYCAFVTSHLCDMALKSNLVYHGRTGHLLLPGISHVLRIRVVQELEKRIDVAMARMNVSREKARKYLEDVDEDIRRWVRIFYDVEWDIAHNYDFVVNLEQMSMSNAAAALCSVAALPDFQVTPASRRAMQNLHLAATVRLNLARDDRTRSASFRVLADGGSVLVTYQPRDAKSAEFVPAVAKGVAGLTELRCTMADTSILWIQEKYDAAAESYGHLVELARRWNAAVELLRFVPWREDEAPPAPAALEVRPEVVPAKQEYDGGIEDDVEELENRDDGGLRAVYDSLGRDGVAGGARAVRCKASRLLDNLNSRVKYALVVVGDVFLSHERAARVRLTRELTGALLETLKVPVVGAEELKKTYMFTKSQAFKLFFYLVGVALLLGLILGNQGAVLRFLHGQGTLSRSLATAAVLLLIPCFAYLYGTLTKNLLKLIRIE